ncbi:MAG: hypothetical protein N2554_06070 [Fimbriimonadales bacterium]|nr:hypothetical protein [Fimbriimonadales bacterium]
METLTREEELIVSRLIEELKQHPRLRRPLIEALEMVGLLDVPQQLDELKKIVEQILLKQQEHDQRFARIEQKQEEHSERLARVEQLAQEAKQEAGEAKQAALEANQEAGEAKQVALEAKQAALEAKQEAGEAKQAALEAKQVAGEAKQAALEAKQEAGEAKQAALGAKQESQEAKQIAQDLRERIDRVERDLAIVKGNSEELHASKRMPAVFGRYLRKLRIYDTQQFGLVVEEQFPSLSVEEQTELLYADWFVQGRVRGQEREVWLVVEVSWGVGIDDVERAHARATILRRAGADAYGVAMGRGAAPEAVERAQQLGVILALDGTIQNAQVLHITSPNE